MVVAAAVTATCVEMHDVTTSGLHDAVTHRISNARRHSSAAQTSVLQLRIVAQMSAPGSARRCGLPDAGTSSVRWRATAARIRAMLTPSRRALTRSAVGNRSSDRRPGTASHQRVASSSTSPVSTSRHAVSDAVVIDRPQSRDRTRGHPLVVTTALVVVVVVVVPRRAEIMEAARVATTTRDESRTRCALHTRHDATTVSEPSEVSHVTSR